MHLIDQKKIVSLFHDIVMRKNLKIRHTYVIHIRKPFVLKKLVRFIL